MVESTYCHHFFWSWDGGISTPFHTQARLMQQQATTFGLCSRQKVVRSRLMVRIVHYDYYQSTVLGYKNYSTVNYQIRLMVQHAHSHKRAALHNALLQNIIQEGSLRKFLSTITAFYVRQLLLTQQTLNTTGYALFRKNRASPQLGVHYLEIYFKILHNNTFIKDRPSIQFGVHYLEIHFQTIGCLLHA